MPISCLSIRRACGGRVDVEDRLEHAHGGFDRFVGDHALTSLETLPPNAAPLMKL